MGEVIVIGIVGGSGSGKTSLLKKLRADFLPEQLCVITQDDYYRPMEEQVQDAWGIENFDLPNSIDLPAFWADIEQVLAGCVVRRREYDFNNDAPSTTQWLTFAPAKILVLEGIFVFENPNVAQRCNLKVFMHAPEHLRIIRRIKRDRIERSYPLEDVLHRYEHHITPGYEQYIAPFREKADLVINNVDNFDAGYEVLATYIKAKLGEN